MTGANDRTGAGATFENLAKVGWAARGVSYVMVGVIAARLVIGFSPDDADQQGALQLLAGAPLGRALVAAMAAGLLLFVVWQAFGLRGVEGTELDDWLERAAKIIGIVFYSSLIWTAIQLVIGVDASSAITAERLSAFALQRPAGRLAVAAAGVIVIIVAVRRGRRTLTGDLDDDLELSGADNREAAVVEWLGRAGEVGRALSFLIIGGFLLSAARSQRSSDAGGLDTSLRNASDSSVGAVAVAICAAGFVVYGLYSITSARHRVLAET